MAKRGGKAATRRQRQRAANRTAPRPAATPQPSPAPSPTPVEVTSTASGAAAPSGTAAPASPSTGPRRRSSSIATDLYGSSRLSEKAAAEYHYVVADLRNIVILSAVLAGLLVVAFVVINVLGVGRVV